MTRAACWLVGQATINPETDHEEDRVSVSLGEGAVVFIPPTEARQMATFLLLAAENIDKEGGNV